jgi:CHAD domain-containing protein
MNLEQNSSSGTESRTAPSEVSILPGAEMAFARPPMALDDSWRRQPAWLALRLLPGLGIPALDFAVAYQAAERVADQRARFEKSLGLCQHGCDAQSVHSARVQCRRLMARLYLLKEAFPSVTLDSTLRSLKRFLKRLGELRDVQVQKQALTNDLGLHPEVAGVWIELGRREQELMRLVVETTRRFRLGKLARRMRALEAELTDPTARLAAKAHLRATLIRAVEAAYADVNRRRLAIDPSVPSTVHRVRVAYKKFRYMIESLPPAIAEPSASQLSAMANYQAAMGRIQDIEVLDRFVNDYAERFPLITPDLARFRQVLLARRRLLVSEYLGLADSLLSFWPL